MEKLVMSIPEMGERLGISKTLAYPLSRSKGFPIIQIGTRRLVPVKAFERWVEKQTEGDNNEN